MEKEIPSQGASRPPTRAEMLLLLAALDDSGCGPARWIAREPDEAVRREFRAMADGLGFCE